MTTLALSLPPRIVIGGVSSGVGKTTVTLGLARALARRGLRVRTFKCGPDYLDPTFLAVASGGPCHNLDSWLMGTEGMLECFAREAEGCDLALIEGVMGLFDGASPTDDRGSTAALAKSLGAPVLLVVDASGMARSLAALAHGFATFDAELRVSGVIANRVGSSGHLTLLRQACRSPEVVGGIERRPELSLPERHLGLERATPTAETVAAIEQWSEVVERGLDLDRVIALAKSAPAGAPSSSEREPCEADCPADTAGEPMPPAGAPDARRGTRRSEGRTPERVRIGIAQDEAFHFYYSDNLARLRAYGAELVPFSPLHDRELPLVDGLYLGGGYPEVHAAALHHNQSLRAQIHTLGSRGLPIYAECGGFMYLAEELHTLTGASYRMVGLLPVQVTMQPKLAALGYVEAETQLPSLLGPTGTRFRGHEFRYSTVTADRAQSQAQQAARDDTSAVAGAGQGAECTSGALRVRRRRGGEVTLAGFSRGRVLGSYVHAHFASNPSLPQAWVRCCALYQSEQNLAPQASAARGARP